MNEIHSHNLCEAQKENNILKINVEELTNDVISFIQFTYNFQRIFDKAEIYFNILCP